MWLGAGFLLTALGFVGYLVPGLPGTVFILGAVACFSRSSPRMERWLVEHPWFGPMLRDWREHRGIRRALKGRIVFVICVACGLSAWLMMARGRPLWLPACVVGAGLVGVAVVVTRPEPPE